MKTLDEAWAWYDQNRQLLGMMQRLGDRYWADLPWGGRLGNDDRFRLFDGDQVGSMARQVLAEFEDLAVFVIFSVFEATVRSMVTEDLQAEVAALRHPALRRSSEQMLQNIADGSFSKNVLDLFKRDGSEPANRPIISPIEEVDRVRRHRNWVAHGRKVAEKLDRLAPKDAYDILQAFLTLIRPTN